MYFQPIELFDKRENLRRGVAYRQEMIAVVLPFAVDVDRKGIFIRGKIARELPEHFLVVGQVGTAGTVDMTDLAGKQHVDFLHVFPAGWCQRSQIIEKMIGVGTVVFVEGVCTFEEETKIEGSMGIQEMVPLLS